MEMGKELPNCKRYCTSKHADLRYGTHNDRLNGVSKAMAVVRASIQLKLTHVLLFHHCTSKCEDRSQAQPKTYAHNDLEAVLRWRNLGLVGRI
jgi:hypothetical protein